MRTIWNSIGGSNAPNRWVAENFEDLWDYDDVMAVRDQLKAIRLGLAEVEPLFQRRCVACSGRGFQIRMPWEKYNGKH